MRIENRASVAADPDVVFDLLNDPERIVGCIPGAALTGRDGEAWAGGVSVKVGPITAAYAGTVRFLDVDRSQRAMRLVARGAETRGSGDAEAEVTLRVQPAAEGSQLLIDTDLLIRGKLAQFGKGAIARVSSKILDQFAVELGRVAAGGGPVQPAPAPSGGALSAGGPRGTPRVSAMPVAVPRSEFDAVGLLVGPLLKTYGRPAALVALGLVHGWVMGRAVTIERLHRTSRR